MQTNNELLTETMALVDEAAALKAKEKELAARRLKLEEQIAKAAEEVRPNHKKSVKLSGQHAEVIVQFKEKETWQQEVCKEIAHHLGHETFHELFQVSFKGRKRLIQQFMAGSEDDGARKLLAQASKVEPGRSYLQYQEVKG